MRAIFLLGLPVAAVAAGAAALAGAAPGRPDDCEAAARGGGGAVVCVGTIPAARSRVVLRSQNGSSEHGVAWVTFGLNETKVVIRLTGAPSGVRQPAHLQTGRCTGPRGAVYPLGTVLDGRRTARIAPLPRYSGFTIAVRESTLAPGTIVACGVIPRRH